MLDLGGKRPHLGSILKKYGDQCTITGAHRSDRCPWLLFPRAAASLFFITGAETTGAPNMTGALLCSFSFSVSSSFDRPGFFFLASWIPVSSFRLSTHLLRFSFRC